MESPPSLGLGTINIAPFVEGLLFTRTRVWSLGMVLIHRSASTHCVPSLNLIKGIFNMLF